MYSKNTERFTSYSWFMLVTEKEQHIPWKFYHLQDIIKHFIFPLKRFSTLLPKLTSYPLGSWNLNVFEEKSNMWWFSQSQPAIMKKTVISDVFTSMRKKYRFKMPKHPPLLASVAIATPFKMINRWLGNLNTY